jgi:hypothetical protein
VLAGVRGSVTGKAVDSLAQSLLAKSGRTTWGASVTLLRRFGRFGAEGRIVTATAMAEMSAYCFPVRGGSAPPTTRSAPALAVS